MRTINKIIDNVRTSRGAPMGRHNVGEYPGPYVKTYDCYVPMLDGAYDRGGAYWGLGSPMRVRYTKCLTYIEFYRQGEGRYQMNDTKNVDCCFVMGKSGEITTYLSRDEQFVNGEWSDEMALYHLLDNARMLGNGWDVNTECLGLTEAPAITNGTDIWYWAEYQIWGVAEWLIDNRSLKLTKA